MRAKGSSLALCFACAALAAACDRSPTPTAVEEASLECSIPIGQIYDGGPGKDGIPALVNPPLVRPGEPGSGYLREEDRVIGVLWQGQAIAVPHNIGWWHEIVNFDAGGQGIAVTFCPLTGSSLAFDRRGADGATFGVSGLLYRNNLIMYDRNSPESLWPQMARGARCGARTGAQLPMIPVVEMKWRAWLVLHPDTRVVSSDLGRGRDYTFYPYGSYEQNDQLLFPIDGLDRRRPLKERVLGVPTLDGARAIAFPFTELARAGRLVHVRHTPAQGPELVVFWDEDAYAAMAYRPVADGRQLTFEVRSGAFMDRETGSTWFVDGIAREGPLRGERLEPVAEAYIAFWFAWAAFHSDTGVWTAAGGVT